MAGRQLVTGDSAGAPSSQQRRQRSRSNSKRMGSSSGDPLFRMEARASGKTPAPPLASVDHGCHATAQAPCSSPPRLPPAVLQGWTSHVKRYVDLAPPPAPELSRVLPRAPPH